MALTRSSFKCCISGISLDTTEAFVFEGSKKVIHARLWDSWKQKNGEDLMPDGMPTKESLTWPPNFKDTQQSFIILELNLLKTEVVVDHSLTREQQLAIFKYLKVLFSWFFIVDAQCALIELNKYIESVQLFITAGPTEIAEQCLNLLQSMMVSVFQGQTQADVIADFDTMNPISSASSSAIWRYIVLSNGIISEVSDTNEMY
jgi:hypothetical protein